MATGKVLKYKREDRLTFIDVAVLKVIIDYVDRNNQAPTRDELYHRVEYTSLINDWLEAEGVDGIYASPITGSEQLDAAFKVLRKLSFIEQKGSYTPTSKGRDYIRQVGNWRSWAISIPINEQNELIEEQARYVPEF